MTERAEQLSKKVECLNQSHVHDPYVLLYITTVTPFMAAGASPIIVSRSLPLVPVILNGTDDLTRSNPESQIQCRVTCQVDY